VLAASTGLDLALAALSDIAASARTRRYTATAIGMLPRCRCDPRRRFRDPDQVLVFVTAAAAGS